jgi:hypothetical protein
LRAYTVAAASVALHVPPKWMDNILSHHTLPGVTQARQGVARRITAEAVLTLEIALRIARGMAVPMHRALELAIALATVGSSGLEPREGVILSVDLDSIRAELYHRLAHAVEVAPSPRRGRPPR